MVLMGSRRVLNWVLIMPREVSFSDSGCNFIFPVGKRLWKNFTTESWGKNLLYLKLKKNLLCLRFFFYPIYIYFLCFFLSEIYRRTPDEELIFEELKCIFVVETIFFYRKFFFCFFLSEGEQKSPAEALNDLILQGPSNEHKFEQLLNTWVLWQKNKNSRCN